MVYRREIDGLRAIAVLSVILFHANFKIFSGGFVGVDIFFVISGFLITAITIEDLRLEKFSLLNFYERRARRILPALYIIIAICIPASWVILGPYQLSSFSESIAAVVTFRSNHEFLKDDGYFEVASELKPLLHTWSLAIEEQYYIIFPSLMLLLFKFGKKLLTVVIGSIIIFSLSLALWNTNHGIPGNFFLFSTRVWEISAGSIAALLVVNRKVTSILWCELFSTLGLLLITYSILFYDKSIPFPSAYTITPIIGSILILTFAYPGTKVSALLGLQPLVFLGLISYSAYLWHQPLFAFTRNFYDDPDFILMASLILLCLALGFATYKFIETPFRIKDKYSRKFIFITSATGVIILFSYGMIISSLLGKNFESILAETLRSHGAIYASNMDERLFIKYRINFEDYQPGCIAIGSSRIMQIGNENVNCKFLNLGVSGASVQDDVAILGMAFPKFKPKTIFIGVDPWLFNSNSSQGRWVTLKDQYATTTQRLNSPNEFSQSSDVENIKSHKDYFVNMITSLYLKVNINNLWANNDTPSLREKIRHDGKRVYSTNFIQKKGEEREKEFEGQLIYGMNNFNLSRNLIEEFQLLIRHYQKTARVILILSPYHPELYHRIESRKMIHLEMEKQLISIAHENGVDIVGSYDPGKIGCIETDFYDGMHPNSKCMGKALSKIKGAY